MVTDYAVYISHFVRHFFKERQKKKAYTFLLKNSPKQEMSSFVPYSTAKYHYAPYIRKKLFLMRSSSFGEHLLV